jgi:voltage-gated potassium channel
MYHVHGTHIVPGMSAEQQRKAEKWELPAIVVALLVIPYLLLDHFGPSDAWESVVDVLYLGIWSFFVVEALRMLSLVPDNRAWVRRNVLDVTIIAATAPVSLWPEEFEVLQVLWLLRILDLLPVIHHRVFRITVIRFAFILWILVVLGGGLAYATLEAGQENPPNLLEAIYWANTTVSTVGYGDLLPNTWQTILLAIPLQAMGVVLGAILVAGVLPLFERDFAEGFSSAVAHKVDRLVGDITDIEEDVNDIEADIDDIAQGERSQDRVLAQIARDVADVKKRQLDLETSRSASTD